LKRIIICERGGGEGRVPATEGAGAQAGKGFSTVSCVPGVKTPLPPFRKGGCPLVRQIEPSLEKGVLPAGCARYEPSLEKGGARWVRQIETLFRKGGCPLGAPDRTPLEKGDARWVRQIEPSLEKGDARWGAPDRTPL